jgi:endonuclease YncB( thermonuclease family)
LYGEAVSVLPPHNRPLEAFNFSGNWEIGEMGREAAAWHFIAAILLALPAGFASASDELGVLDGCRGAATRIVSDAQGARGGATILLKDGTEVRLAGVIAPDDFQGDGAAAKRAAAALDAHVAGRRLFLHSGKNERDRYGRLVAQVAVEREGEQWVQAALVSAGQARILPGSGDPDCAERLLRLERQARGQKRGLWSDAAFSLLHANAIPDAEVAAGRFALVEAAIHRVGEAGGRIFLDFGRRYREDFTIVIPREAQAAFAAAGVDLRSLSGKRVRARGVLFNWGGPAMELRHPAALELIEADEG